MRRPIITLDEDKKRTIIKNRVAARKSVEKKNNLLKVLIEENRLLKRDKQTLENKIKSLELLIQDNHSFSNLTDIRSHSVQEIISNEKVEIRVDTRINTDVKIQHNKPDIFIFDKVKNEITLIEVGITSQDNLQTVETEKLRKYDILANELELMYKAKTRIIPYVVSWDGLVTTYYKTHSKNIGLSTSTETYIQTKILAKTLESISLDYRRGLSEINMGSGVVEELKRGKSVDVDFRYSHLVQPIG